MGFTSWLCSFEDSGAPFGLCHVCSGFGRDSICAGYLSSLGFAGWMIRSQCEKACGGEINTGLKEQLFLRGVVIKW